MLHNTVTKWIFHGGLLVSCISEYAWAQQQHFKHSTFEANRAISPATENVITPSLRRLIQDLRRNGSIPGISLGIVHTDGTIETEGFGYRTEEGDATTPDTLFNIASSSKAFTASAIGILIDDFASGRNVTPLPPGVPYFDWDTKVQDVLPDDWQLMDEHASQKANFRDILSHQSGLPGYDYTYAGSDSPLDVIHRMRHLRPTFELRERFQYNNMMYMLVSHVVTLYSGMSFPDFVKSRIWSPLNLTSSTYNITEAFASGLLSQSWTKDGRRIPNPLTDPGTASMASGPGGIMTNVIDLTKWLRMQLQNGVNPTTNATVLSPMTIKETTSAQSIVTRRPSLPYFSTIWYGMGWNSLSYQGHEIIMHSGALPGFSTVVAFLPSNGIGIVVLANADEKHTQELVILYRIIEHLLSLPKLASSYYVSLLRSRNVIPKMDTAAHPIHDTVSVHRYTGTYTNPAYPTIVLCDPQSSHADKTCTSTLAAFRELEDLSLSNDTLYTGLPSMFTTHGRFHRTANHTFQVYFTTLFPSGYGKDTSPFENGETDNPSGVAEFVIEDGEVVGFGINFAGNDISKRRRAGGGIKVTAEAWFQKV
ncbi:beta-lactamase transpeptidase-like protein [Trametopsis cervina]|nr:beta-lactamase transpeptidase-like protein [Trametopsis cervina]